MCTEADELRTQLSQVTSERDDLAEEVMVLQDSGTAYDLGFGRAADAARQAIDQARSERDALRAAIRDLGLCLHLAGWCTRCDGLRALGDGAAEE